MRWSGRSVVAVLTCLVVALGAGAVHAARADPDEALTGGSTATIALLLTGGLGAWTAGCYTVIRLRTRVPGIVLAAAGPCAFLSVLAMPSTGSSLLFTLALVGAGLTGPLIALAALAQVAPARTLVLRSALVVALLGALAPTLVFDPPASGCYACATNLLVLRGDPGLYDLAGRVDLCVVALIGIVLGAATSWSWWSTPRIRVVTASVALPGAVGGLAASVAAIHGLRQPAVDPWARGLWAIQTGALLLMACGIAGRAVVAHRLRDRLAQLVLDTLPDAARLQATLAAAVDDPGLGIAFVHDDELIDGDGRPAAPVGPDQALLTVARSGTALVQIRHDRSLGVVPERLAGAVQASGLALEHAGARARTFAEVDELAHSRARVVATGDAERRRLERDLHDGAQQRLIATTMALQAALDATADPIEREALSAARYEIRHALEELRAIAHGIHPVTLSDAGLRAALHELAEGASVPMRLLDVAEDLRATQSAQAALYRAVADTVTCAEVLGGRQPVTVHVRQASHVVRAELTVAGLVSDYAPALGHAADRARALGGDLRVSDGVRIEVEVPCDS